MSAVLLPIRKTLGRTFSSLQNRNYKLFFIGQTISNTGNWLTNVALTLLVLKLTGSGIAVGILAACQYGPILIFSPYGGVIADRYDKQRMLMWTQSLELGQSAILAVLAFMGTPALGALYAVAALGGVLLAFDNPLRRAFVAEMVPKEDMANAIVLYSTIVNLSRIFGPTLAGLLAGAFGFGWCFTLDAISYTAVLVCLVMMRRAELYRPLPADPKSGVMAGLRSVLSEPDLWIPFAMFAAVGTLAYNFSVTLPLFVIRSLHSSEGAFTMLYSVLSIGSVVCALIVAHRNLVKTRHIVLGSVAFGIAMLLLAFTPSLWLAAPATFLVGMSSVLYMTGTTSSVQLHARPEMQGRVLALQTVLMGGSSAFGGPLVGWIADSMGARAPIVVGGVTCFAAAAFGFLASRRFTGSKQQVKPGL